MTAAQALRFVERRGIVLEAARGPAPSLVEHIIGEPLRGSWWAHPKGHEIFGLAQRLRASPEILVCRLVGGKITYVHMRLWIPLARLAKRFKPGALDAIQEIHTPMGRHEVRPVAFARRVGRDVVRAAKAISEDEAWKELGELARILK